LTAPVRRLLTPALAMLTAAIMIAAPADLAVAAPTTPPTVNEEDAPPLLRDVLNSTGRNYLQAKAKLDQSKKRQLQLNLQTQKSQTQLDELTPKVGQIATRSYRTTRLGVVAILLDSPSAESLVQRAAVLDAVNRTNDQTLAALKEARSQAARAKAALDAEVREQQKQLAVMTNQKQQADRALAVVAGNKLIGGGFVSATSPTAKAAPRTANGGWPDESCSKADPTTSGCITPRTMNAYTETRKAGFKRFAGCYRPGGPYEHPKGRACDWSLQNRGFSPAKSQDQKLYGNNLAAFLIRNADRLGILYVIWYKQFWSPATGWKSYSGASDHTDHVHMSLL
jgi:peptidoglycan DL-endopeptidase CwlO